MRRPCIGSLLERRRGRPCFIGFYGAFHGRTMGALAFTTSKDVQRAGFFPMQSGKGLMIGVDFVLDRATKEPARGLRDGLVHRAFERGLLLLGCGQSVVRISPPLTIDPALVEEGLAIFEDALSEAEETVGKGRTC